MNNYYFVFGLLVLVVATQGNAATPTSETGISPTSVGPTSRGESEILWKDGHASFEARNFSRAAYLLERLLARYPGHPNSTEAQFLLSHSYLELKKPEKAKRLLKDYVLTHPKTEDGIAARIELMRAYLALHQPSEALLTSDENLHILSAQTPQKSEKAPLFHVETLVLKAKALIQLDRDPQSSAAIASVQAVVADKAPPSLKGELLGVRQALKLRSCAKFPSANFLEEAQARDQLGRRGECILESLLFFHQTLLTADLASAQESKDRLLTGFKSYLKACSKPPGPPALHPKPRTPDQTHAYLRELSLVLRNEGLQNLQQAIELLKAWSAPLSKETSDLIHQTLAEMEKLKTSR
ncbi:tetratricopeptide repeat protein [Bdellovibrionota bacterium FG-1]